MENIASIEAIIQQRLELPTPPNVVFRLLEVIKDEERSFKEIGDIISKDPSLTAKMMKVANSSIFGLSGKISTIEGALAVLGINVIRNIALSFVIIDGVKAPSSGVFDIEYFWKRAITAAVAGEILASHIQFHSVDSFLCSLLKDIGVLVMYKQLAEEYKQVLLLKAYAGSRSFPVERELIGFDHGELGGLMLKQWGLPESIYLPIFHHHDDVPPSSPHGTLIGILDVADKLSALYHGAADSHTLDEVHALLHSRFGLNTKAANQMIDSLAGKTVEILNFFDIDPGEMKPLSQLLQEANYELGNRAMSYEHLVYELKQSQEESRQFINKLLEANKSLRKLAYRDELTGLYNHRFFQREIEKELERAKRYGHPLCLIFFDIDFFKDINDTHGHLVGDVVLRTISQKLSSCMRSCDIFVRYGGDEFAIIMPETDYPGFEVLAERLRHSVEKLLIPISGKTIALTVSIGGAFFNGKNESVSRFSMLSVADQAIYQSKKSGRNTVTIKVVD